MICNPGGMHDEHHAASAPRCRGAGASDQRCVEMITRVRVFVCVYVGVCVCE